MHPATSALVALLIARGWRRQWYLIEQLAERFELRDAVSTAFGPCAEDGPAEEGPRGWRRVSPLGALTHFWDEVDDTLTRTLTLTLTLTRWTTP